MADMTQIVCEYRTLFEDVNKTVPNIRPKDDCVYSAMDYGKILSDMCHFLEGYIEYRNGNSTEYDDKIINSTKKFYDDMFVDMSLSSPYRRQITLADMQSINESFVTGTAGLISVMESVSSAYQDSKTAQLLTMTTNQYRKLAKVYGDDMHLYLWLANEANQVTPRRLAPLDKRVAFADVKTPVMHRVDQYNS